MGRTFIRQDEQVRASDLYDDNIVPGVSMENSGSNIEFDLNSLRSQIRRLLASGSGNWYDDLSVANNKQRGNAELNEDLDDLEEKRLLCAVQVLTDVYVPASSGNYVILSAAALETPSDTIASGSGIGAVVAELLGDVGAASLSLISGTNTLAPKNLAFIRRASDKLAFTVSGSEIKGLLQVENGGLVQGDSFNDIDRQAQITFIYAPSGSDFYSIAPADVMAEQTIEYIYAKRITLDTLPEDCGFPGVKFIDQAGAVNVTLEQAINNQAGLVSQTQNIAVSIDSGFEWAFQSGSTNLWVVKNDGSGGEVQVDALLYDNNAITNDFANGAVFDSDTVPIAVGIKSGVIGTDVGNNLIISGSGGLFFDDGNQQGSTWAQINGIKLSNLTEEWDTFESTFGEVSILSAIISGSTSGLHQKAYAEVSGSDILADVNVRGGVNLDSSLLDYSTLDFVNDVNIYVNGVLLRNGANAAANHDVYPGDDPSQGDLKFEFKLKGGLTPDIITMELF